MNSALTWKKYYPLTDQNAFICLVDHMGDDSSIVQAARVSYGKDNTDQDHPLVLAIKKYFPDTGCIDYINENFEHKSSVDKEYNPGKITWGWDKTSRSVYSFEEQYQLIYDEARRIRENKFTKDRALIRYLMNHSHTSPFEMVEFKFMVQVPMDCWRQWVRHRTASINEYSTRYMEAIDACQITPEDEWRLQSTDNKQGSSGYLDRCLGDLITPEQAEDLIQFMSSMEYSSQSFAGSILTKEESLFHKAARKLYQLRLALGIAKEQARKDLPLSTYTRAYWKCDLHNIFNFLRLRMDSHAQFEIRSFANCMFEIIKQVCPVACEAFEDYILYAKRFSRMEMEVLKKVFNQHKKATEYSKEHLLFTDKPSSMTDREWKEFLAKLS